MARLVVVLRTSTTKEGWIEATDRAMAVVAHVLGVAHSLTLLGEERQPHPTDAFATLTVYLSRLLHRAGYVVYVYAVEGSVVDESAEVVPVVGAETFARSYGGRDDSLVNDFSDTTTEAWVEFRQRAPEEILKRKGGREDLVLALFGWAHEPVTREVRERGDLRAVIEPMIGHPGSYADFRVFCSHAWFYWECSRQGLLQPSDYFAVIPHFVDVKDYDSNDEHDRRQADRPPRYAVYLGRIQLDKGLVAAIECTFRTRTPLWVVGNGRLWEDVAQPAGLQRDRLRHVRCLGVLPLSRKREVLRGAYCVFTLTRYCEPFSLACLEAQVCGVPVLCTKFGGFTEIVQHGLTGFHCDTLETVVRHFGRCAELDRGFIRREAVRRFSIEAVTPYFLGYFRRVRDLVCGRADWYRGSGPEGMGATLLGRRC